MDKLSSKLCKNENYTGISLSQIYLSKLQKNILKYFRLNLFKNIAVGFNHCFQISSEFPVSLSGGIFVWIDKCCHYPCLQFIFGVAQSFVSLSLNCIPSIIIQVIAICRVRWPDFWGNVVAEIFWHLLCSPTCVVWHSTVPCCQM